MKGRAAGEAMPECSNCGADVPEGGAYCTECGQQMAGQTADAAPPPPPPPPPPAGQAPQPVAAQPDPGTPQPVYTSPAATAQAGATKSRTGLIVFLVVASVLLLLCCCIGYVGYVAYVNSEEEPATVPVEPATAAETPYTTLTWDEAVDLDLEIWDSEMDDQLSAAWDQGEDVKSAGTEEFYFEDFTPSADFSDGQFSTGTFGVTVFMHDSFGITEDVEFTIVVHDVFGGQSEYTRTVNVAEPENFWEGFLIDAETGEILEVIDAYSGDELSEN